MDGDFRNHIGDKELPLRPTTLRFPHSSAATFQSPTERLHKLTWHVFIRLCRTASPKYDPTSSHILSRIFFKLLTNTLALDFRRELAVFGYHFLCGLL